MDEIILRKISTLFSILWLLLTYSSLLYSADTSFTSHFEILYHDQAVVATAASYNITIEEFKFSYEYGPAFIKRSKNSKEKHLQYMINEKLLAGFAVLNGIDTLRQTREMVKAIHDDLMTEEMFREDIERNISISDAEIDTVINRKNITVELKWIFTEDNNEHLQLVNLLNQGTEFDSLYENQFEAGALRDDRSLKISLYHLGLRNKLLAGIVETLTVGHHSTPVKIENGWYTVKLVSAFKNPILNEEEYLRLKTEAVTAVKNEKMEEISDKFVQDLFAENKPEINGDAFEILQGYVGKYYLPEDKYKLWGLSESLDRAMKSAGADKESINELVLIEMSDNSINLKQFLEWFWIRSQYMKFDETNRYSYASSLKQIVLLMVRDELLAEKARRRGFDGRNNVLKQLAWWQAKIAYSSLRNELSNLIMIENEEMISQDNNSSDKSAAEILNVELSEKIFRLVSEMKKNNPVEINSDILKQIEVSDENNPKAIDLYTVKKGGLIPRTPYPTIDYDWINWE